jgi:hypothetical protein
MTIDRVLLVWDGNPFYQGFYEMHQKLWPKLGIKTSLAFVSNGANAAAIPKTGDVIVLEDKSDVPFTPPPGRNWKATMAIIHAPRLFPGEVVMVTGMDQFPASRMFLDKVAEVPDDELISGIGSLSHIPTGNIVAHHDTWSRIMEPAPMDFTDLIEWTWAQNLDVTGYGNIAIGWGNDEVLFTKLAQQCEGLKVRTLFENCWPEWLEKVLGITQVEPDMEKLKNGEYSELHIRLAKDGSISPKDKAIFDALIALDRIV